MGDFLFKSGVFLILCTFFTFMVYMDRFVFTKEKFATSTAVNHVKRIILLMIYLQMFWLVYIHKV